MTGRLLFLALLLVLAAGGACCSEAGGLLIAVPADAACPPDSGADAGCGAGGAPP